MDLIKLRSQHLEVEVIPAIGGRINQIKSLQCESSPCILVDRAAWQRQSETLFHPRRRQGGAVEVLRWGCYPMAPWPGRIARGCFSFEGQSYSLPTNLGISAIHGTSFAKPWKATNCSDTKVDLEFILEEPWPWSGALHQSIEVHDNSVRLTLEVHAGRGQRFPAGAGWHPWFSRRGMDPAVRLNAPEYLETDENLIPTGARLPAFGDFDLGIGTPLGNRRLDHVYAEPVWPVIIDWEDLHLEISASTNAKYVCIYTPPEGFCIEPMTCAANAFNAKNAVGELSTAVVDEDCPLIVRSRLQLWPE